MDSQTRLSRAAVKSTVAANTNPEAAPETTTR